MTVNALPTARSPLTSVLVVAKDIKLAHTVFALPFAVLAMFLAAVWGGRLPLVAEAVLVVACMFFARTFAMTVNRAADARLDAANPRTRGRGVPSGRVSRGFVVTVAAGCAAAFVACAAGFWFASDNPWPAILAVPVLVLIGGYSFTKRFTPAAHLVLGVALAASPLAAAIATEPGYLGLVDTWLLAGFVACWVAGFDIIYALQDIEADRRLGLQSIPARLGGGGAMAVSRLLHLVAIGLLIGFVSVADPLGPLFVVAVVAAVALLLLEHVLIWRSAEHHLDMAFFTLNGVLSVLLGVAGVIEVVLRNAGA